MKRLPALTLALSALAVAIHSSPTLTAALELNREAALHGELWRVLTGHFTHFGAEHLRWDVIAFLAFGSLAEIRSRRAFLLCLVVSAVAVSLGVCVLQPQFATYRGLSGVDSALFTFVVGDLLRAGLRERDKLTAGFAALALAGFLAKSAYELASRHTLFVSAGATFEPVPLAHLLGAVVGVLCAIRLDRASSLKTSPSTRSA